MEDGVLGSHDTLTVDRLFKHGEHIKTMRQDLPELDPSLRSGWSCIIDYAESNFLWIADFTINEDLWGFGEVVPIYLSMDESSFWTRLYELEEPAGVSGEVLEEAFTKWEEIAPTHVGRIPMKNEAGDEYEVKIVGTIFIFYFMATHSIWSNEFMENFSELMLIAYHRAGMGDEIPVLVAGESLESSSVITLNEYVERAGLPDIDEAQEKSRRGLSLGDEDL